MRILGLLILAGCATASKPYPLFAADGREALYVECRHSPGYCHEAAKAHCPTGYVPIVDNRRSSIVGDAYGAYSVHIFELTFRCK